ncbi:DUF4189 domain-containing protein [Mycolicibacterium sphagni]|uniref:DUF4189 domain-containing protein n=1 Tax=Mycolicibacterium sphagni TaxID=1786 RepID=A0A255DKW6_9MYCO|nr:DUF4189 domain-containing protein [Mycolicibacterium sphagni]MCV7178449.1 DUF4189 domain-containing protein [Mycolicibacterium sphagni]OYN79914.1 hypothetical protein CG716_10650 [Mycolicibacterium sphagni]
MKTAGCVIGWCIGVVAAAGSLASSPAAHADIDFECEPGCWGAAAASTSTGQEVMRLNYETRQGAEDAAELWCDVKGKTNDCQVLASGLGCLSIAVSPDGKTFAGGNALFQDAADGAALNGAPPGSTIDLRDCNG